MRSAFVEGHLLFESCSATERATRTILLVNDDLLELEILTDVLSDAGYRVVACPSAAMAVRWFDRDIHVDLLLTDLVMPGIDGLDLAHQLTRLDHHLPVVILSGKGIDDLPMWELWRKRWLCLAKPTTLTLLLRTVDYASGLLGTAVSEDRPGVAC